MRYLLDTGVLARIPHRSDPEHPTVRAALRTLAAQKHEFVTARQNIVEFWNLCTRPATARGGFDLSTEETGRRLRILERFVTVLNEPESTYGHWKRLVREYRVMGRQVHDARLAAVMLAYRIKRIVTLNATDFGRYPGIEAITPREVAAARR